MNKKAIEIQFNWIFVLVAGAAILIFFGMVVFKQKEISQKSVEQDTLKAIELMITGTSVSKDTIKPYDIPESKISVECNRISVGTAPKSYESLVLFSPSLISGNTLITQTLSLNIPYRVANLLYATSPMARYIIVGNNEIADEIESTLPSEIKKENVASLDDLSRLNNLNNYKVKIIITNPASLDSVEVPKPFEKMADSDLGAIIINGDIETGDIDFYQKNKNLWSNKGSLPYFGMPTLIGAVYSENIDFYKCNMENVMSRVYLVSRVYEERTKSIPRSGDKQCAVIYKNAENELRVISESIGLEKDNIANIIQSSKNLENENNNAEQISCTLIY